MRFVLGFEVGASRTLSAACLLGAMTGCSLGQIGGEVDNSEGHTGRVCDEVEEAVGVEELTELGFSAEQLSERIEGSFSAPMTWKNPGRDGVEVVPAAGETTLDVTVVPRPETAVFVQREPRSSGDGREVALVGGEGDCPDVLRIESEVHVESENGALDDTFIVVFEATDDKVARASIALPPGELEGSFDVDVSELDNATSDDAWLRLQIAFGAISGTIEGSVEQNHGDAVSSGVLQVAHFPSESNCEMGVPVGDSAWTEAIEGALAEHTEYDLTWQGQDALLMTIEPTPLTGFCFEPGTDGGSLRASGVFHVSTEDGSIDGTWPLDVVARLDDDVVSEVKVVRNAYLADYFAAEDFAAETGISGVEREADGLTFSFSYLVHLDGDAQSAGELTLMEVTVPDCAQPGFVPDSGDGSSAPGCPGLDVDEFQNATFIER